MALPDPHADELSVELDSDLIKLYRQAKVNAQGWKTEEDRLRKRIEESLGDAFAGTVDGEKVVTYRATSGYAEARIRNDFPELVQHYMRPVTKDEFDMELFAKAHPEIAEKYRIRSFRNVG